MNLSKVILPFSIAGLFFLPGHVSAQTTLNVNFDYLYYPDGNITSTPESGKLILDYYQGQTSFNFQTKTYVSEDVGPFYLGTDTEGYPKLHTDKTDQGGIYFLGTANKNFVEGKLIWTINLSNDGTLNLQMVPPQGQSFTSYNYEKADVDIYEAGSYIIKDAKNKAFVVLIVAGGNGFSPKKPPSQIQPKEALKDEKGEPIDFSIENVSQPRLTRKKGKKGLSFTITLKNNSSSEQKVAIRLFMCLYETIVADFKQKPGLKKHSFFAPLSSDQIKMLENLKRGQMDVQSKVNPYECSFDVFAVYDKKTKTFDTALPTDANLNNNFFGFKLYWKGSKLFRKKME